MVIFFFFWGAQEELCLVVGTRLKNIFIWVFPIDSQKAKKQNCGHENE